MDPLSQRGLERRIKRQLKGQPQSYFCPTEPGFEDVLLSEIKALSGVTGARAERGGVNFIGDLQTLYHANLRLYTAGRVLLRLGDFLAQSYPMLYDRARRVPWELYLGFQNHYSLHISSKESRLNQPDNLAETLHAAITKRLAGLGLGTKQVEGAALELHMRLYRDRATLSLNTSGDHLHKRGYRQAVGAAPLRETLAAGILLRHMPLERFDLILDPMCGSGTLLCEAALLLSRTAPGLMRDFAFQQAVFFQASLWERLKREAAAEQIPVSARLVGVDSDKDVLEQARANAARLDAAIRFEPGDALVLPFEQLTTPSSLTISNVPYGTRLGSPAEAETLLVRFANALKNARGDYGFVSQQTGWLAALEPARTLVFKNGGLRVVHAAGRFS